MKSYKGNMLLIELVIVILFFSLSQVVIVQVFSEAQRKTVNTTWLNTALAQAEDTVERLAKEEKPDEALKAMGYEQDGEDYVYREVSGVELVATIHRLTQPAGEMVRVEISARQGDAELFVLPSLQYFATEVQP